MRRALPGARLSYVVERPFAPLLAPNPHLDEVVAAARSRGWHRVRDDLALGWRVRRAGFDVAIDFHGGPRSGWLTWASGAPVRIGYSVKGRSWIYTQVVDRSRALLPRHSVENQWDLITSLHPSLARRPTPSDDPVEMPDQPEAARRVGARLEALGIDVGTSLIVVHIGAGNSFRLWPEAAFAGVIAQLSAGPANRRIIVTAGAQEAAAAARVRALAAEHLGDRGAAPTVICDLDLPELRSLIGRASVFIGNDSGPLHMAATTDTPIVGIYGPTLTDTWRPWRDASVASELVDNGPLPCRPCAQRRCEPGDFRCLTQLPAERVASAAERLLAATGDGKNVRELTV